MAGFVWAGRRLDRQLLDLPGQAALVQFFHERIRVTLFHIPDTWFEPLARGEHRTADGRRDASGVADRLGLDLGVALLVVADIVDEDLAAYKELYNWMESLTDENFVGQGPRSRRIAPEIPSQADISVSILSSHNNQNNRILYKGCTPTSIGALEFTTTSQTVEFITFDVTFGFTGFDFKG